MAPQSQKRPTTQRPACRWQSALQRCRSSWLISYEDKSIGFYLPLSSTLLPDSLPCVTLAVILSSELNFCDRCMLKTRHEIIEEPEVIYTYKRKRLYKCKECGHKSYRRGLRPSAESVY